MRAIKYKAANGSKTITVHVSPDSTIADLKKQTGHEGYNAMWKGKGINELHHDTDRISSLKGNAVIEFTK